MSPTSHSQARTDWQTDTADTTRTQTDRHTDTAVTTRTQTDRQTDRHCRHHTHTDRQTLKDTAYTSESPPASWIHFATQSCFMSQVQRVVNIAPEIGSKRRKVKKVVWRNIVKVSYSLLISGTTENRCEKCLERKIEERREGEGKWHTPAWLQAADVALNNRRQFSRTTPWIEERKRTKEKTEINVMYQRKQCLKLKVWNKRLNFFFHYPFMRSWNSVRTW